VPAAVLVRSPLLDKNAWGAGALIKPDDYDEVGNENRLWYKEAWTRRP
jgi:hypothetical protein